MGGGGSTGRNNNELVDNLMKLGYIRTKNVERVFRLVDRANYILPHNREGAYKDVAWKHGNIHLSAPCIYSEVLEALALEAGLSFLNIGSGTGYLSTMAGLLLSTHGINHGIELYEDCLKYAHDKLEEFKQKSAALDEFDFCEPVFVQGNCLNVVPDRQYDRVYCGAACPEHFEGFIRQFVTIGGILVMPTKDLLLRLQKLSDDAWSIQTLLPVSFATLIIPPEEEHNVVRLPECVPRTLQEICRDGIRRCLRNNVWQEHSELMTRGTIIQSNFQSHYRLNTPQRIERDFVIPTFDVELDSDDDAEDYQLVAVLLQSNPDHTADSDSSSDPKINSHSNDRCSENANLDQSLEQEQNLHADSAVEVNGAHTGEGRIQECRNTMQSQRHLGNNVNKQNKDEDVQMEAQSEIRTSHLHIHMDNEDETNENNIDQRNPAVADTEASERRDSLASMNDSSSNADSHNQSPSDTMMDLYFDHYQSSPFERVLVESTDLTDSKDTLNTVVKDAYHVDNNAFTAYMTEKIFKLPLPLSLKMYINYNRQL